MSRRSIHPAGPAAVAALAVLISLEVVAVGVPTATLASAPAAILHRDFDRRAVATFMHRLSEGVRADDLLPGLDHGHTATVPTPPPLQALVQWRHVDRQRVGWPVSRDALTHRLIDLPPPTLVQA
jgi:hypothetical protein